MEYPNIETFPSPKFDEITVSVTKEAPLSIIDRMVASLMVTSKRFLNMVCILLVDTAPKVLKIVAKTDMVEPYCVYAFTSPGKVAVSFSLLHANSSVH